MPGVHKIGAAISGPRIAGKQKYKHEAFAEKCNYFDKNGAQVTSEKSRMFKPWDTLCDLSDQSALIDVSL